MSAERQSSDQKLVLFDIDGTLLMSGGAGKRAMIAAFDELFGIENAFENVHMYGRTDPEIFRHALDLHGLEWRDDKAEAFKRRYFQLIEIKMQEPGNAKRLMPGIPVILDLLGNIHNVHLGLLTGNWRRSAIIKLNFFNLANYFSIGAFADDSEIREELLPYAVERYRSMLGLEVEPRNVFVVGDTPRDVQCARPHNATTVAVATGWTESDELARENPDYLFKDLSDASSFLALFKSS